MNKLSILNGAKYFSSGIFEIYLVFMSAKKYIKYFNSTTRIGSWESNGISEENIENVTKSDGSFAQTFVDHLVLTDISFNENCLINNIYIPKKVINIYTSYIVTPWLRNLNTDFTLKNLLFGTKNTDPVK